MFTYCGGYKCITWGPSEGRYVFICYTSWFVGSPDGAYDAYCIPNENKYTAARRARTRIRWHFTPRTSLRFYDLSDDRRGHSTRVHSENGSRSVGKKKNPIKINIILYTYICLFIYLCVDIYRYIIYIFYMHSVRFLSVNISKYCMTYSI